MRYVWKNSSQDKSILVAQDMQLSQFDLIATEETYEETNITDSNQNFHFFNRPSMDIERIVQFHLEAFNQFKEVKLNEKENRLSGSLRLAIAILSLVYMAFFVVSICYNLTMILVDKIREARDKKHYKQKFYQDINDSNLTDLTEELFRCLSQDSKPDMDFLTIAELQSVFIEIFSSLDQIADLYSSTCVRLKHKNAAIPDYKVFLESCLLNKISAKKIGPENAQNRSIYIY